MLDTAFLGDQQATIDFAYQAVERVTTVAKAIIARHYRQPISRSYYTGCSTGGREAMLAAQRYPLEFDGVIAGAPNMRINYAVLGLDWINVQLNQVAPRGTNGQPVTREALSSTQKQAVIEEIRNACDANDGVRDGLVFHTSACKFDPGGFNGSSASTTDLDAAARWAESDAPSAVTDTYGWTNMTTFASRVGKMIFFHGVSDPTFSALDTVDYYNRLAAANGGADAVQRWSRLFLVPGMGHCGGGSLTTDSFDLLTALVNWVERDIPPEVVATRNAEPRLTRPLCAYPRYARYSGRGDQNDAASFACQVP